VQVAHAIEGSEVRDYTIKATLNTVEFFDAENRSIDAPAAGNAYHFRRSVDGADGNPAAHKVQRIFTGPASEIEQSVGALEKYIQAPPHSFSLQATNGRTGPKLVISRRYPIESCSCDGRF
jgi:hypothetical protein